MIQGVPVTTAITDAQTAVPFAGVSIVDDDSATLDAQVSWTAANGSLSGGSFGGGGGTVTLTASPADVESSLNALTFDPVAGTADTAFVLTLTDDGGPVTATTTVSVSAVPPIEVRVGASGVGIYGSAASVSPAYPDGEAGIASGPTTCSTTTTATTDAGDHPGTASCTGATANPGYTIAYVAGTTTIAKAPLTVTASGGAVVYGGAAPTITPSYSGFVNGEDASVVSGTACAPVPPIKVPTATTSCSGTTADNYAPNYVGGQLSVTAAPLLITPTNGQATYGSLASVTATYAGFVNGDSSSALTTPPYCTTNAGPTTHVGVHASTTGCAGAVAPNYSITYGGFGTTTITPAPLTITALSQSRPVGQANANFSADYSGLVNNETASVLKGTLSFSTTAATNSPAGSYTVTPSGLTSSDYAITFKSGTVTVTQGVNPTPTPTATPTPTPSPTGSATPTPSPTSSPLPNAGSGGELDWLPWVLIPAGALFIAALIAILAWRRRAY